MQAMERADQLPPEDFEAVERAAFLAAQVETELAPICVRVARISAEDVELGLPLGAAMLCPDGFRQRGIEGVVRGDAEQGARRIVDEVRQLLRFILGKQAAGLQAKLLLELGEGWQMAEDDQGHARRIAEIRSGSKVKSSMNPQFCAARG